MPDWIDTIANRRNGLVAGFVGKDAPLGAATPAAAPLASGSLVARPAATVYGPGWWLGEDGSIWHSDGVSWSRAAAAASSALEALAGGNVEAWDNFARSDRWLTPGIFGAPIDWTPSGHRIDWQGTVPAYLHDGMLKCWGDDGTPVIAVTLDAAANTVVFGTAHGLTANRIVRLPTLPPASGLTAEMVDYFVVNPTTNTIQLALTSGGAPIDIGGAGGPATITGGWDVQTTINLVCDQAPKTVTGTGRFAPGPRGDSGIQEIVIICSDENAVSTESVQCRVRKGPNGARRTAADWRPFVFDQAQGGRVFQLDDQPLSTPIPDGVDFTFSMTLDPVTSEITFRLPDGSVRRVTDPLYAAYWGRQISLQSVKSATAGAAYGRAIVSSGKSQAGRDRVITKIADDAPGNNTLGYVADPVLQDHIEANQTKVYEWVLRVDGSDTGNASFRITVPTGATGDVSTSRLSTAAASAAIAPIQDDLVLAGGPPPTATFNHGLYGPGTVTRLVVRATVYNGANAGDVKLNIAQNSGPDAANFNRILKGSRLRVTVSS